MASLKTIHQRKETVKTILTLIAAALGVIQTSARAAEEPAWSIEAKMISADSCSVGCPCILGEPPTHGQCQYVALWQVESGRYGDVKLDGVKFAFAGEFAQKVIGEPVKKAFVAYYIDLGASAEQKEALLKLFTGPSFAGMGPVAEVKEVAINFENLDAFGQVGKKVSCTVGEISRANLEVPLPVSNMPLAAAIAESLLPNELAFQVEFLLNGEVVARIDFFESGLQIFAGAD